MLMLNILLALTWISLTGQFTLTDFVTGFVLGYLIMYLLQDALGVSDYCLKVRRPPGSICVFAWKQVFIILRAFIRFLTHYTKWGRKWR